MNDEQQHNDPIERLFREKAEQYDISYKEEDWLKLEKQLDVRDMQRRYRRRMRWLAAASFLILSLLGYYTLQNHNKINQLTEQLNQNEMTEQTERPQDDREVLAVDPDESSGQTGSTQENPGEEGFADSGRDTDEEFTGETNLQDMDTGSEIAGSEPEENRTVNLANEGIAEANQIIQRKPLDPVHFQAKLHPGVILKRDWMQPFWLAGQHVEEESEGQYSDWDNSALALMEDESVYPASTSTSPVSRFAVGFVVSPDLSTAGSVSNFYDPGFKGGLMAEYSLSRNFSLLSGLTISNAKYKAAGQAYNPPPYWNSGVPPDETTAVCLILDIPVSLKANLKNFERSRIFATVGVSSYIMLNEDYRFSYNGDPSGLQTSWNGRTGTRHWMSNAGFSVGIEWDLAPKWTFRAEPHIKIPLKGVGWGDVELYSMGSFFSINYKL